MLHMLFQYLSEWFVRIPFYQNLVHKMLYLSTSQQEKRQLSSSIFSFLFPLLVGILPFDRLRMTNLYKQVIALNSFQGLCYWLVFHGTVVKKTNSPLCVYLIK